jgi:peroxiredoxin Q/BCP
MMFGFGSDPLPAGSPAPDFTLPDETGRPVTLSALRGQLVLLVFYPGDNTPGCTSQLCNLRNEWNRLAALGAAVYGVNPQSAASHQKFRARYDFPFPLLVDRGRTVARLYNASGLIVKRTVYLIGRDGTILFARRGMPPLQDVLAVLLS